MSEYDGEMAAVSFDDPGQWADFDDTVTLDDTESSSTSQWGAVTPAARSLAARSVGRARRSKSGSVTNVSSAGNRRGGGETGPPLGGDPPTPVVVDLDRMAAAFDKVSQDPRAASDVAPDDVHGALGALLNGDGGGDALGAALDGAASLAGSPSQSDVFIHGVLGGGPDSATPSAAAERWQIAGSSQPPEPAGSHEAPPYPPPGMEPDSHSHGWESDGGGDSASQRRPEADPLRKNSAARAAVAWLGKSNERRARRMETQLREREEAAREAELSAYTREISRLRIRVKTMEREIEARTGGVRSLQRENHELVAQVAAQTAQLRAMRVRISALHSQVAARRQAAAERRDGGAGPAQKAEPAEGQGGSERAATGAPASVPGGGTPPQSTPPASPRKAQGTRIAALAHTALAARAASLRLRISKRKSVPGLMVVSGVLPRGHAGVALASPAREVVLRLCERIEARQMMLQDATRRHASADPRHLAKDEFASLLREFDALPDDDAECGAVWKQIAGGARELPISRLRDAVLTLKMEHTSTASTSPPHSPEQRNPPKRAAQRRRGQAPPEERAGRTAANPLKVVPGTLPASREAVQLSADAEAALRKLCAAMDERRLRLRDLFGTEVGLPRDAFAKAFSGLGLDAADVKTLWRLACPPNERVAKYVPLRDAVWSLKGFDAGTHQRQKADGSTPRGRRSRRKSVLMRELAPFSLVSGMLPAGQEAVAVPLESEQTVSAFCEAVLARHLRVIDLFTDGSRINRAEFWHLLERLELGGWMEETKEALWMIFVDAFASRRSRARSAGGGDRGVGATTPVSEGAEAGSEEEAFDVEAVREVILSVKQRQRAARRAEEGARGAASVPVHCQEASATGQAAGAAVVVIPSTGRDTGGEIPRTQRESESPVTPAAGSTGAESGGLAGRMPAVGHERSAPACVSPAAVAAGYKSPGTGPGSPVSAGWDGIIALPAAAGGLNSSPSSQQRGGLAAVTEASPLAIRQRPPTPAPTRTLSGAGAGGGGLASTSRDRSVSSGSGSPIRASDAHEWQMDALVEVARRIHEGAAGAATAAVAAAAEQAARLAGERNEALSKVNELINDLEVSLQAEAEASGRARELEAALHSASEKARSLEYELENAHAELAVTERERAEADGKVRGLGLDLEASRAREAALAEEAKQARREAAEAAAAKSGGCCAVQ